MGLGIMLGAAAKAGVDTYERLNAEDRRKKEFAEQERLRQQRKALEEQSAALPAMGATVDANTLPETQRNALGLKLTPATQDNNMVQPATSPAPTPLWQQNAQGAATGLPGVVADNTATGAMPTRAPNQRAISQSDQMMMLADVYRRNGQPEKAMELAHQGMKQQADDLGAAAAMSGVRGWDALNKFASQMNDGKDFVYSQIKGGKNDGKFMVQYGDGQPQIVNDSIHAGLLLSAAIKKDPQMIAQLVNQYGTRDLEQTKLDAQAHHWAAEEEIARSHVKLQGQIHQANLALQAAQARHLDAQAGLISGQLEELQRKAKAIGGYADLANSDPLLYGNDMLGAASTAETADPERLVQSNTVIDQNTGNPVSVTVGKLQGVVRARVEAAQRAFQENPLVKAGKIVANPQLHQYGVVDQAGNIVPQGDDFDAAVKAATKIWGAAANGKTTNAKP